MHPNFMIPLMTSFSSRIGLPLGKVLVVVAVSGFGLIGCGGSSSSPGGSSPVAAVTPLVTVTPVSNTLTAGATVSVVVAVSGGSGTPAGSVVLSSGSYASFATTLVSGSATIAVPTGLLVTGSDTLTAAYTPGSASVGTYNSASGTGSVTVQGTAVAPTVTASAVTYPTTGAAFDVLPLSNGSALVAVPSGVQVFVPAAGGGLTASCIDTLGATLTGQGGAVSELSLLPGGVDLAAGIGSPGAAFFNLAQAQSCAATPTVVSQGTIASAQGTQAVAVTADGKYAFVSNEYGVVSGATTEGNVGVVQLAYDSNGNVTSGSTLLGQISTGGQAVAGMLLSPDGTRLYVTSEIVGTTAAQGGSNPVLARTGCVQAAGGTPQANGTLTVINVAKAESAPGAGAIVATVDAGCSPVRMAETADGQCAVGGGSWGQPPRAGVQHRDAGGERRERAGGVLRGRAGRRRWGSRCSATTGCWRWRTRTGLVAGRRTRRCCLRPCLRRRAWCRR